MMTLAAYIFDAIGTVVKLAVGIVAIPLLAVIVSVLIPISLVGVLINKVRAKYGKRKAIFRLELDVTDINGRRTTHAFRFIMAPATYSVIKETAGKMFERACSVVEAFEITGKEEFLISGDLIEVKLRGHNITQARSYKIMDLEGVVGMIRRLGRSERL